MIGPRSARSGRKQGGDRDAARVGGRSVAAERASDHPERTALVDLLGAARRDLHAAPASALDRLGEQAALADAGLAVNDHYRRPACRRLDERAVDHRGLPIAAEERGLGRHGDIVARVCPLPDPSD